jgi:hypothetical protein
MLEDDISNKEVDDFFGGSFRGGFGDSPFGQIIYSDDRKPIPRICDREGANQVNSTFSKADLPI